MNIPAIVLLSAITLGSVGGAAAATEPILPDRGMTPGGAFPVTTADICVDGYTKLVRNVTVSERRHAYAEYGERNVRGMHELDHLVPLELGGSNELRNLWPQPYHVVWNAHVKDRLENTLHRMVCANPQQITLAAAQHLIATDWIAAYKTVIGPTPTSRSRHQRRRRSTN